MGIGSIYRELKDSGSNTGEESCNSGKVGKISRRMRLWNLNSTDAGA